MASRPRVVLIGESPLLQEYAALCLSKGYDVHARLNSDSADLGVPKGTKKVAKPTKAFSIAFELTNTNPELKRKNIIELDRLLGPKAIILSSSLVVTVAEQASWVSRPERLVGIGAFPTMLDGGLIELATSSATDEATLTTAKDFVKALGKESAVVQDSIGMVMPRVLCMLINEACFAMMEGVAAGKDIDTAMKLGTNYPSGPVEWGKRIGFTQVEAVLSALHHSFGEDRYRVAPLLRQMAFRRKSNHKEHRVRKEELK